MQPVSLALLWHQHQPYYPDDVSGQTLMPWVRLHGTKDYYGMAMHIKEVPEFRCTINLVPSLLVQLDRYTKRGGSDRHLDVSRLPAGDLAEADMHYLLDHFFMASVDNMIRPYKRYYELYLKRGVGVDLAERAAARFSKRDVRDLQVWSNLTWMHEIAFEQDAELKAFREKGRNWSEREKEWLLDKQKEILGEVVPLHRELADGGQVELTTTPYFHPILPLLWDKKSARQAMPHCSLPQHLDSYREDAVVQIARAVAYHEEQFGSPPRGMWPSEGSVSQDVIGPIAAAGIEWIATDEEILAESTNGWISRDGQGHMRHPEMLFRPWQVTDGESSLQVVFRDHALSDLIGFHYQRSRADHAAGDLIGRVEGIARAVEPNNAGRPALVPIVLDGENCWEYYADGGVEFLRQLYRRCADHKTIEPTSIGDYLENHPATDRISHLYAGSWISHNFAIWIGHQEDNTAWDLLHQTREFLRQAEAAGGAPAEVLAAAWEELYIAEGSDWFWWFGDDHHSEQDALFDQLFRRHLQNVYTLLGVAAPQALNNPIATAAHRAVHTQPTGFLPVKVDGRYTYFEWISAGRYTSGNERGTMTLVSDSLIREVYFGFDVEHLLIRIDTLGEAADDLARVDELRVRFVEPTDAEIRLGGFRQRKVAAKLFRRGRAVPRAEIEAACESILEMSVRLDDLKVQTDDAIQLHVEASTGEQSLDRAPQEGNIETSVPSPDFELMMWQA